MENGKSVVEFFKEQIELHSDTSFFNIDWDKFDEIIKKAKQMEMEQCYSKEDVLKAGEIGEINHHDCKHIVNLLDEAKKLNNL